MEDSLIKKFATYVSLNMLGMVGISCYILADTFFVSKSLGSTGIAALNLSIPIYSVINGVGLMIGVGGATRFSILKSQKKPQKAEMVFSTAIKIGIIIAIIFVIIGLFASKHLALLLGADVYTLHLTKTYLSTIMAFAPFFILNNIVLAFVRNDNNPKLSMIAMLIGSFSNIILDYIFMFPLRMGMFGAAFATGLAPVISICVLLLHFVKKKDSFVFLKNKISLKRISDILSLGSSAFIIEVSSAVVLITFNIVILRIKGNLGVASYGIVANLSLVAIAIFTGLGQGVQPLTSKYYGLGKLDIVGRIKRYAVSTSLVLAAIIYFVIFVLSERIVSVFNSENNPQIAQMADKGLKIYFIGFIFVGINIVTAMFLSAIENSKKSFIISIARGFIIIVPIVIILSRILNMEGVWISFVLTELIVSVIAIYLSKNF